MGRAQNNNIILRGFGIQDSHAEFNIDSKGNISLNVSSQQAFDQTLVNGKYLEATIDNFKSNCSFDFDPYNEE